MFGSNSSVCQNIEVPLKPLNLHQKIFNFGVEEIDKLALSEIVMKSDRFFLEDSVMWISGILPDIPSMVDSNKKEVQFVYKSSFVGTTLIIKCKDPD